MEHDARSTALEAAERFERGACELSRPLGGASQRGERASILAVARADRRVRSPVRQALSEHEASLRSRTLRFSAAIGARNPFLLWNKTAAEGGGCALTCSCPWHKECKAPPVHRARIPRSCVKPTGQADAPTCAPSHTSALARLRGRRRLGRASAKHDWACRQRRSRSCSRHTGCICGHRDQSLGALASWTSGDRRSAGPPGYSQLR